MNSLILTLAQVWLRFFMIKESIKHSGMDSFFNSNKFKLISVLSNEYWYGLCKTMLQLPFKQSGRA